MTTTAKVLRPLYYFTVEDESILAEAFDKLDEGTYAITFKVKGTEDVFVTTSGTREAMDLHDIAYNLLAEEESSKIGLFHSPASLEELGEHQDGVRALVVCPGVVDTPIHSQRVGADPEKARAFLEQAGSFHPMGRVGTPEEVAELILFLASDASAWTTGSVITVDGGISLA